MILCHIGELQPLLYKATHKVLGWKVKGTASLIIQRAGGYLYKGLG